MNIKGRKVTLHDMSLRDGMHPQRHQISVDQMVDIAQALDAAKVPLIEAIKEQQDQIDDLKAEVKKLKGE